MEGIVVLVGIVLVVLRILADGSGDTSAKKRKAQRGEQVRLSDLELSILYRLSFGGRVSPSDLYEWTGLPTGRFGGWSKQYSKATTHLRNLDLVDWFYPGSYQINPLGRAALSQGWAIARRK
jgi:hypothetical protein